MSMPGADFRPDDGPYSVCSECGAQVPAPPDFDDETGHALPMLCEECAAEQEDE